MRQFLTNLLLALLFLTWTSFGHAATSSSSPAPAIAAASMAAPPHTPADFGRITSSIAIRGLLILALFLVIAVSIATRRVPAMVALPLMALGIGLIAGIPFIDKPNTPPAEKIGIMYSILEGKTPPASVSPSGSFTLYKAIIYVLLGGMFARFISDARIAERIIKYAAEFGGEDPFFIALLMSAVTALVFTAVGGLPIIIMLGTIMFPVLLSLGVPPAVCGGMLLLAFPIGSALSPAAWAQTSETFAVPLDATRKFFIVWAGIQTMVLLAFLSIEFLRMKRTTVTAAGVARSILVIAAAAGLLAIVATLETWAPRLFGETLARHAIKGRSIGMLGLQWAIGVILILGMVQTQLQYWTRRHVTTHWNMLTPILPLILTVVLGMQEAIVPAFMAALAYGYFTTPRERGMQKLSKSIMDGISDVAAPVALLLGIGMLVAAAMHPMVKTILLPLFAHVMPTTPLGYVVFFLLLSPLALYRGPLNPFGLGAGIARVMNNFLPAPATMGAIQSVGMLQDPTTTQNVWVCGYLKLDVNALLFKLFFYSVVLCVCGLLLSVFMFFR